MLISLVKPDSWFNSFNMPPFSPGNCFSFQTKYFISVSNWPSLWSNFWKRKSFFRKTFSFFWNVLVDASTLVRFDLFLDFKDSMLIMLDQIILDQIMLYQIILDQIMLDYASEWSINILSHQTQWKKLITSSYLYSSQMSLYSWESSHSISLTSLKSVKFNMLPCCVVRTGS